MLDGEEDQLLGAMPDKKLALADQADAGGDSRPPRATGHSAHVSQTQAVAARR